MKILLISYDNGSHISYFPQGLAYIAASLQNEGYEIDIYNQDVYHYDDEHLLDFLNNEKYDVVGISFVAGYYQYKKIIQLSKIINSSKNRPNLFILGGHGPSPSPEYFLRKTEADVVVIGEGEETIVHLLKEYKNGNKFDKVEGIAFFENGKYVITKKRKLIEDLSNILLPAYDLFPIEHYRLKRYPNIENTDFAMPILSGRGCKFLCNFCYRLDKGLRIRKDNDIINEMNFLYNKYDINYFAFFDELLMTSKKRTMKLCQAIIDSKLKVKWYCNGRLNFATKEVLKMMKAAGCVFINYGIESFNDDMLKVMNKSLTTKVIESGIQNTLEVGISPGLNVIFGNIGETKEHLKNSVDFLLKYDDQSQVRTIRTVTPYPGSPLYYYAIENGFIEDIEDFYENKLVNSDKISVNFTNMTNEEIYNNLYKSNELLLRNYYNKRFQKDVSNMKKVYFKDDNDFRGFRPV